MRDARLTKRWLRVEFDLWVDGDVDPPSDPLEFLKWFRSDSEPVKFVDALAVRDLAEHQQGKGRT